MSVEPPLMRDVLNGVLNSRVDGSGLFSAFPATQLTPAELAAGVTPANYAYAPEPSVDVRRYGWSASNSAADNKSAIDKAILVLQNFASIRPGGTVLIPAGQFACDAFIVPQYVHIVGAGVDGTTLLYTPVSGGTFITCGGFTGALHYGCGIRGLGIVLGHKDAHGIELQECASFQIEDVAIEGTQTAARTNTGVTIDGGTASSFHGDLTNVLCNHVETGHHQKGALSVTQIHYYNCGVVGDNTSFPNSVGFSFDTGHGDGTNIYGGNLEHCGTGILSANGALCYKVFGTRFEGNTTDIVLTAGCRPPMFFGLTTDFAYNVTDANAVGGFFGCTTTSASRWAAQGSFTATLSTMAAATTGAMEWRKENIDVELQVNAAILGVLNGTSLQLGGLPSGLIPGSNHIRPCVLINQGNVRQGLARINSAGGTIDFYIDTISGTYVQPSLTGFTTATTTGLPAGCCLRYRLD